MESVSSNDPGGESLSRAGSPVRRVLPRPPRPPTASPVHVPLPAASTAGRKGAGPQSHSRSSPPSPRSQSFVKLWAQLLGGWRVINSPALVQLTQTSLLPFTTHKFGKFSPPKIGVSDSAFHLPLHVGDTEFWPSNKLKQSILTSVFRHRFKIPNNKCRRSTHLHR